jgi:hypothetical protein
LPNRGDMSFMRCAPFTLTAARFNRGINIAMTANVFREDIEKCKMP